MDILIVGVTSYLFGVAWTLGVLCFLLHKGLLVLGEHNDKID